jgi:hypothetical protein
VADGIDLGKTHGEQIGGGVAAEFLLDDRALDEGTEILVSEKAPPHESV